MQMRDIMDLLEVQRPDYKKLIDQWEREVREAAWGSIEQRVDHALDAAHENASQTEGVRVDTPRFFEAWYESIAFTSAFADDKDVQQWFEARGYRW